MSQPTTTNTPESIQAQMATIRHDIDDDVQGLVTNARQMTDWTHYVRASPWGSMVAAAVVGYLVVPNKLFVKSPDAGTMAKLAKDNRIVVESKPEAVAKTGLAATAFTFLAHSLLRAGMAYAGQQIGAVVGEASADAATGKSPRRDRKPQSTPRRPK